jgi:hypothetical protein
MAVHVPIVALLPPEARSFGLLAFLIVNPFVGALLATWLNEKQGGGSIVPGWILHGGGNLVAYASVAFWTR